MVLVYMLTFGGIFMVNVTIYSLRGSYVGRLTNDFFTTVMTLRRISRISEAWIEKSWLIPSYGPYRPRPPRCWAWRSGWRGHHFFGWDVNHPQLVGLWHWVALGKAHIMG